VAVTVAPCPRARERRRKGRERAGLVAGRAEGARVRMGHAHAFGWAERPEKRGEAARDAVFCFSFSKNVNSIQFYLFCCKLFKIPKIIKNFE
jgi:hypothetical protein